MRSALLMTAVCAAGVLGTPLDLDKRAYETEWSFFTVTSTTTGAPVPVEQTQAPAQAPQQQQANVEVETLPPTTTHTLPPVVVTEGAANNNNNNQAPQQQQADVQVETLPPTTTHTLPPVAVTDGAANNNNQAPAPAPATTEQAKPSGVSNSDDAQNGNALDNAKNILPTAWTSSWSTEWTSTPTEQPTTLSKTTADSGSRPTNQYQETLLYNHNVHRSNHSAPSLTWSNTLEASAQKLAAKCVYKHDTTIDGGGYGQNIGYGVSADNIGQMITNLMYNDEMGFFSSFYGVASPIMKLFDSWGHFTQIVWKSTKEVGCYTMMCDNLGNVDSNEPLPFTVCNYSPAGNANGEYADNVLKPLGHAMLSL